MTEWDSSAWPRTDDNEQLTEFGPGPGTLMIDESSKLIAAKCDEIKQLLLSKNLKYGDSALKPIRIFSNESGTEQLRVRIDDKISRIKNNGLYDDEDTVMDLVGYLILLRISLDKDSN